MPTCCHLSESYSYYFLGFALGYQEAQPDKPLVFCIHEGILQHLRHKKTSGFENHDFRVDENETPRKWWLILIWVGGR